MFSGQRNLFLLALVFLRADASRLETDMDLGNPPEVAALRAKIGAKMKKATVASLMGFIAKELPAFRKMLIQKKRFVTVKDYDEFAKVYQKEFKAPVTAQALKARKQILQENKNTGMTGPSGIIYVMNNDAGVHDGIHEIVHLLTGGTDNNLKKASNQFVHEGLTELYTKELCKLLKARDSPAYAAEVAFLLRLKTVVGDQAFLDAFWNTYSIDGIADNIGKQWMGRLGAIKKNKEYFNKKKVKHSWKWLVDEAKTAKTAQAYAKKQLIAWNPNEKKTDKFWKHAVGL